MASAVLCASNAPKPTSKCVKPLRACCFSSCLKLPKQDSNTSVLPGTRSPRRRPRVCSPTKRTSCPAKRWLLSRYAQLADRLIGALHADVLIFGSGEERPLAEEIARAMKHTPLILAGETSLRQLMALFAQCRLVVSNDSGSMHLAAALGLPVVAIFGSTDERATGPVGARARVVKKPVDCSPCGLRECPIDFRCMKSVSVDDVFVAALELVKEAA